MLAKQSKLEDATSAYAQNVEKNGPGGLLQMSSLKLSRCIGSLCPCICSTHSIQLVNLSSGPRASGTVGIWNSDSGGCCIVDPLADAVVRRGVK